MNTMSVAIGIVTPSYNQGEFLEETIDSVLSQKCNGLQYVIIDGGSTDQSREIIRKYERYLTYWVSEKDRGQSHAINKGLRRLRTDVWAYLNSDDTYLPGTLDRVAAAFADPAVDWVTGRGIYVDAVGNPVSEMIPVHEWTIDDVLRNLIANPVVVAVQVSNFMRSSIIHQFGYFNEALHYCMDVEYGLRPLLAGVRPAIIDEALAAARLHSESKTMTKGIDQEFARETAEILECLVKDGVAQSHLKSILSALNEYRLQQILTDVKGTWRLNGRMSGIVALARAVATNPSLATKRPILGLWRRLAIGSDGSLESRRAS